MEQIITCCEECENYTVINMYNAYCAIINKDIIVPSVDRLPIPIWCPLELSNYVTEDDCAYDNDEF